MLGSSTTGILYLLTKKYLLLILIANLIAAPLTFYLMNKWLQDFAYRANINVWVFFVAAIVVLLIASLTIFVQAIRAATANPVKSLKYE